MSAQGECRVARRKTPGVLGVAAFVLCCAQFLPAQATISAGPLVLQDVKTIYIVPSSDDFVLLVKARLEKWGAIQIVSRVEDADAVLYCQSESAIVPAKIVIRRTIAELTLSDRRTLKPIWKTRQYEIFEINRLADEVVEQLQSDWRKSATDY